MVVLRASKDTMAILVRGEPSARWDRREARGLLVRVESGAFRGQKERLAFRGLMVARESLDCRPPRVSQERMAVLVRQDKQDFLVYQELTDRKAQAA